MSDPKLQPEPTMDEILASIRRIISEDQEEGGGGGARAEPPAEGDDTVLELTDIVGDAGAVEDAPAAPAPPPAVGDSGAVVDLEALVSGEAARRTSAAFVDLAEQIERSGGGTALAGGRTLDELVKDLLRPMLKAWLDANLPPLVQRLVEAEIARLAGRSEEK